MDRQSDRVAWAERLDRVATGNFGEDSVYSESAENERIGELVKRLVSVGQLRFGDGLNTVEEMGYFVMWGDGSQYIIKRNEELINALENVWASAATWLKGA